MSYRRGTAGRIRLYEWVPKHRSCSQKGTKEPLSAIEEVQQTEADSIKISVYVMQRYYIKFCQNLDTEVQTIQKIQQAFGNDAMDETQIKNCTNASKKAACQYRMKHAQEGHLQATIRNQLRRYYK